MAAADRNDVPSAVRGSWNNIGNNTPGADASALAAGSGFSPEAQAWYQNQWNTIAKSAGVSPDQLSQWYQNADYQSVVNPNSPQAQQFRQLQNAMDMQAGAALAKKGTAFEQYFPMLLAAVATWGLGSAVGAGIGAAGAGAGAAGAADAGAAAAADAGAIGADAGAAGVAGSAVPETVAGFVPDFAGAGGSIDLGLGATAPTFASAGGGALSGALGGAERGAINGAINSGLSGRNPLTGAVRGGLSGGLGGFGSSYGGSLGGWAGNMAGNYLGNDLFGNGSNGSPSSGSGASPSPRGSGAGSTFGTGNGMNLASGFSGSGVDWNNLLGGLGGLYNSYTNAQSQQNVSGNQSQAFKAANGAYGLGNYGFNGPGGITATGGPNGGVNLGSLNPAFAGFAGTAANANGMANSALTGGLPANVQNAYALFNGRVGALPQGTQGMLGSQYGALMGGQGAAGGLTAAGFGQLNNPLIGQANRQASGLLSNAGNDFNSIYNNSYANLLQQLQQPTQQAQAQLMDQEFQRGQMGSTAGGLQTQAFAKGLGQAYLGAQNQAYNQALGAFNTDLSGASALSGIANNGLGLGTSMIGSGLNGLGSLSGLASNDANSIFNQNSSINNTGFNQAFQNLGAQTNAAMIPAGIANAYQGVGLGAANGANILNQLGLNNYNTGLNSAVQQNTAQARAAGIMGGIANNPNYMPGSTGYGNLIGSLFGNSGAGGNSNGMNLLKGVGSLFGNFFGGGNSWGDPTSTNYTGDFGTYGTGSGGIDLGLGNSMDYLGGAGGGVTGDPGIGTLPPIQPLSGDPGYYGGF